MLTGEQRKRAFGSKKAANNVSIWRGRKKTIELDGGELLVSSTSNVLSI
jgi:hypothetical protein